LVPSVRGESATYHKRSQQNCGRGRREDEHDGSTEDADAHRDSSGGASDSHFVRQLIAKMQEVMTDFTPLGGRNEIR
jgi:hypothetical protein